MSRVRLAGTLAALGIASEVRPYNSGPRRFTSLRVRALGADSHMGTVDLELSDDHAEVTTRPPRGTPAEAAEEARETAAVSKALIHEFLEAVTTADGRRPLDPHRHPELEARIAMAVEREIMRSACLFKRDTRKSEGFYRGAR